MLTPAKRNVPALAGGLLGAQVPDGPAGPLVVGEDTVVGELTVVGGGTTVVGEDGADVGTLVDGRHCE